MQRLPLALLLLCTACPAPEPTGNVSSASGAPLSSSSASADAGAWHPAIALGDLCRQLRTGYRRAFLRTLNRCGAAYEDTDLERLDNRPFDSAERATLQEAQSQLLAVSCDQFGSLRIYLDHVLQSVDRGRVTYDEAAAFKCREASTQPTLSARDRPPVAAGAFVLEGIALPDICNQVFAGLVPEDGACDLTHECAAPMYCRPSSDETSVGTCKRPVPLDVACDSRDVCDNNGVCEAARCRSARGQNESCVDAQGYTLPCGPGLLCNGGSCVGYGEAGALCASGNAPCRPGLVCSGSVQQPAVLRCAEPVAVGSACVDSLQCEDCARCNAERRCEAYLGLGDNCIKANDGCAPGLRCGDDNTCRHLPREGELCEVAFAAASSQRGNCMFINTFCARERAESETGTCRRFPTQGEACGSTPGTWPACAAEASALYCSSPTGGVCVPAARLHEPCTQYGTTRPGCEHGFCRLAVDAGDEGTCAVRPNIGEACGQREDLSEYCQTGFCMRLADAPTGICSAYPDIGETCGTPSHLSTQCTYGACFPDEGGTTGRCNYQVPAGAPCTQNLQCEGGLCDPHVRRCITPGQSCQGCSRFEPILFILSLGMVRLRRRTRWRNPAA